MLQSQLMLAHLRQNGADVQVDVAWVGHLQTVINCHLAEVQVVVLNLKGLLQIGQGTPQLLGASEDACEVIVSDGTVTVTLLCQGDSLVQQLQGHREILLLQEAH